MSDPVLIVLIIAVAVIVVLVLFRKQLSRFFIKAGREGVEADLTTREPASTTPPAGRPGTVITGNRQIGRKNKIDVGRTHAAVQDNLQLGEGQELKARPDPKTPAPKQ